MKRACEVVLSASSCASRFKDELLANFNASYDDDDEAKHQWHHSFLPVKHVLATRCRPVAYKDVTADAHRSDQIRTSL